MFADARSLENGIARLTTAADDLHLLLCQPPQSPAPARDPRSPRTQVAAEVRLLAGSLHHPLRLLAGSLHSLRLLASSFLEGNRPISASDHNLNFLRACGQTIRRLRYSITEPEPAADVSGLPDELGRFYVQFGLALVSKTFPALLTSLSQRSVPAVPDDDLASDVVQVLGDPDRAREEVFDALCPWDPAGNFATAAERSRGIPRPVIEDEKPYQGWRETEVGEATVSRLRLHGQPGVGKTALAVAVVRELRSHAATVCYHFVDVADDSTRKPANILGSLIWQLASRKMAAYNQLRQFFHLWVGSNMPPVLVTRLGPGECQDYESVRARINLFRMMQSHFETIYLVIDGMDDIEDTETASLLEVVGSGISEWTNTRALLVGRDNGHMRKICDQNAFASLELCPPRGAVRDCVDSAIRRTEHRRSMHVDAGIRDLAVQALACAKPK